VIRFDLVEGRVELVADRADADALTRLTEQFTGLLAERDAPSDTDDAATPDPALARLFPDPIPDDPDESVELRELTRPGLVSHKRANAERVARSLANPGALEASDELAWLQWLTDIRIVLASRLGILLDGDEGASATESEQAMQWMYHALGSLQADLIDVLDERAEAGTAS
jgi:hypothetical protein